MIHQNYDFNSASSSFENLKRARATPSSDSVSSLGTGAGNQSKYSFFPPKRRARSIGLVKDEMPKIPIIAAPPVAETREAFSWADLPQSSRHYTPVAEISNQQVSNQLTLND